MRVSISSDHRGGGAVEQISAKLESAGHDVHRVGPSTAESVDYPDSAVAVARDVSAGESAFGILVCGTGIGMSIAANKVAGVRAALVHDELTARLARSHNDANVLCLSADLLGDHKIEQIVETFLETEFEGGRHARRVGKISLIERGDAPSEPATA
ncbi:MAG: ribose 5-phosphate isomerase B [Planctomycetota bacterium]